MDEIIIIIVLILLNGVFAMSEIALVSARKSSLAEDVKRGNKRAKIALKLAEEPDRFLSTVQIGITLIGILTGMYSGNKIAAILSEWVRSMGVSEYYSESVAQIVVVIIVTYLTLVLGELLPKRIGLSAAEKISKFMAHTMYWLSVITSPFVWLLSKSTALLFRILGIKNQETKVTEAEIKSIINEATEDGEVQQMEQDIMERVFFMGDLKINSIMTPRRDIIGLTLKMTAEEIQKVVSEDLFEMYPVTNENNEIKGVVTLKRLFCALSKQDFLLNDIVEEADYFYENMSVYKVLEEMKTNGISKGLVCDEYGECVGIVTLKDLMEGLVGIVDEDEEDEPQIVKREGKEEWIVDGQCPLHELLQYFECEEFYDTDENFSTVAGLCLDTLEHIPEIGEKIKWNTFLIEISDMDGVRIDKVLVSRI